MLLVLLSKCHLQCHSGEEDEEATLSTAEEDNREARDEAAVLQYNNIYNNSTARVQAPKIKNEPSLFRFCLLTTNPK